jgi:hypothetical protein
MIVISDKTVGAIKTVYADDSDVGINYLVIQGYNDSGGAYRKQYIKSIDIRIETHRGDYLHPFIGRELRLNVSQTTNPQMNKFQGVMEVVVYKEDDDEAEAYGWVRYKLINLR